MTFPHIKWGLAVMLSFVVLSASQLCAGEINLNQLHALADTSVKLLQNGDFHGAAMMYHYPAEYSPSALDADMSGVTGSLQIFAEDFGRILQVQPLTEPVLYVNIFATGGTHDYWDKHPTAYKIEYQAEFENYGQGYLVVHAVDIIGLLEIKTIAFGLPVTGESVARIKKAGDRMLLLNRPEQKPAELGQMTSGGKL